jgi:hypothetical protein
LNLFSVADSASWIASARLAQSRAQLIPLRVSVQRAFDPASPRPYAYFSRMFVRWLRGEAPIAPTPDLSALPDWLLNTNHTAILIAITEDDIWSSASNDRLLYSRWLQGVTASPHLPLPSLPWVHHFAPHESPDAASLLLLAQAMQWDWFAADAALDRTVGGDHDERYFAYSNHGDVNWLTSTLPFEPRNHNPSPSTLGD